MRPKNPLVASDKEIRGQYCKICGGELRGKIVREGGWSYHLGCWRKGGRAAVAGSNPAEAAAERNLPPRQNAR
jgi:hypothetical protein